MELKTLKDLEKEYEWKWDTYNALKQEAIKWVKADRIAMKHLSSEFKEIAGIISNKWMERFNITEDDLK